METITWRTVLSWMILGAGSWTESSLEAPRLSLFPSHAIFVRGEWMTLSCSVPEGYGAGPFCFYCNDESGSNILEKCHQINTLSTSSTNLNAHETTKTFTCSCSGVGQFYSSLSNLLVFLVVDDPPSPLLKVDPLSQMVKEGECLLLLCSAEGGNTQKRFHFYKDGVEMTSHHERPLKSSSEPTDPPQNASLSILHAKFQDRGEFACRYEEERSGRWILSSWSPGVNVTVQTPHSGTMWIYAWLAIPFIILLVAFAFYCWKKTSKFEAKENKEERDDLGMMDPQAARAAAPSPVKDSEVTYSLIQVFSTQTAPGPTMEDRRPAEEEGMVLYSDLLFQPIKGRARKHTAY